MKTVRIMIIVCVITHIVFAAEQLTPQELEEVAKMCLDRLSLAALNDIGTSRLALTALEEKFKNSSYTLDESSKKVLIKLALVDADGNIPQEVSDILKKNRDNQST